MDVPSAESYLKSARFKELCDQLAQDSHSVQQQGTTLSSLQRCATAEVFRWFVPAEYEGWGWHEEDITRGYLQLAKSCLSTTFVITQWASAVKRLVSCPQEELKQKWLPKLAAGHVMVSVGISHLTTSRQHQGQPALRATPDGDGWRLEGYTPWVTGGSICDMLIIGATVEDGRQLLLRVDTTQSGIQVKDPFSLMALTASQTGAIEFDDYRVKAIDVLAGPVEQILHTVAKGTSGGLQTSTLALGLSLAALEFIEEEAKRRENLESTAAELRQQYDRLLQRLLTSTRGEGEIDREGLRTAANDLVLRASQAALLIAKGAGFVQGHPCERWCREALFFLVWSCPQVVQMNQLCQLATSTS